MEIPTGSRQMIEIVEFLVQEMGFEKFLAVAGIKSYPPWVHYMMYCEDEGRRRRAVAWLVNAVSRCPSVTKLVYSISQRAVSQANINVSLQGGGILQTSALGATSDRVEYEGVKGRLPAK
ncbi:MAG: hypothetical protein ABC585_05745 [Candidatus Methanosuratincola petrocarbonis]